MHEEVEYGQLQQHVEGTDGAAGLDRLRDVPVDLVVEIGRTRMTIGEALKLTPGAVIGLNKLAGDPVSLLANGKPIARGEVVVVDEEFGLRVTEVVSAGGGAPDPRGLVSTASEAGETPAHEVSVAGEPEGVAGV